MIPHKTPAAVPGNMLTAQSPGSIPSESGAAPSAGADHQIKSETNSLAAVSGMPETVSTTMSTIDWKHLHEYGRTCMACLGPHAAPMEGSDRDREWHAVHAGLGNAVHRPHVHGHRSMSSTSRTSQSELAILHTCPKHLCIRTSVTLHTCGHGGCGLETWDGGLTIQHVHWWPRAVLERRSRYACADCMEYVFIARTVHQCRWTALSVSVPHRIPTSNDVHSACRARWFSGSAHCIPSVHDHERAALDRTARVTAIDFGPVTWSAIAELPTRTSRSWRWRWTRCAACRRTSTANTQCYQALSAAAAVTVSCSLPGL